MAAPYPITGSKFVNVPLYALLMMRRLSLGTHPQFPAKIAGVAFSIRAARGS
jgi:hypothetical protein